MDTGSFHRQNYFNPRSRGGSDFEIGCILIHMIDFNPRSRGGSDLAKAVLSPGIYISIHAPAGGATSALSSPDPGEISIHAPAGGATTLFCKLPSSFEFQSTLPRGERRPGFEPDCLP